MKNLNFTCTMIINVSFWSNIWTKYIIIKHPLSLSNNKMTNTENVEYLLEHTLEEAGEDQEPHRQTTSRRGWENINIKI